MPANLSSRIITNSKGVALDNNMCCSAAPTHHIGRKDTEVYAMASETMKYGMFVHYVEGLTCRRDGTIPSSGMAAGEFDVEGFAESLQVFGVEYIIFTAWHFNMVCLYPAAKVDAWLPDHSVNRDLIGEIIAALKARGIKVMLYTHPRDGHDFSEEDAIITG